jgi:outer membrane receptor protein involved in Fe transport
MCSRKTTPRIVALSSVTALLGLSGAAVAQDMEEITVTATKREATIQDVPFSINAQTAEDIQRTGATDIEELSRNVAGLTVQNLGPGQSQVAIRGVSAGQIVRDQPGVKEQVGVYLDESVISLSLFTPDFDLYDLNRVETLRGPQGTLFGSGSVGGTIRYITNKPDRDAFQGDVELNLNNVTDGETGGHVKGMLNLPLGEGGNAALRLVGYTTEYAGFVDARLESGGWKSDVNSGNRTGIRATLDFDVGENVTITPRVIYQETEADGFARRDAYNLFANPYTDPNLREPIQLGGRQQHLLLDEGFSDETLLMDVVFEAALETFDFTFVGSQMERDIVVSRDASALSGSVTVSPFADLFGFPLSTATIPSNLVDTTDLTQSTFEARISSNTDGKFDWLVGMFHSDLERGYTQRLPTPGYDAIVDTYIGAGTADAVSNGVAPVDSPYAANLPYDIQQFAVFGEATYHVSETLRITAGGRWYDFEEERIFWSGGIFSNGDGPFTDNTSSDGFTPRVLASWDFNDSTTFNAQASQGFRLGGVNDPLNEALCTPDDVITYGGRPLYDDEKMWNYEAGMKSQFGNGVTLNAAVFYSDIEDLQVTFDAGTCSSRVVFNVADAHTAGVEFELSATPTDQFFVSLAGSILESEFDSAIADPSGDPLNGVEDGNRLASVPEIQLAATGEYVFDLDWFGGTQGFINGTVHHVGDRITQPGDQVPGAGDFPAYAYDGATGTEVTSLDLILDAYTIINLSAGIEADEWSATLYIHNVGDEEADLSFNRERGGLARTAFFVNRPRTIGLTFRKSWGD